MQCIIDTKLIFLLEGFRECQEKFISVSLLQKLLEVHGVYDKDISKKSPGKKESAGSR
jgi:hypothetical protein